MATIHQTHAASTLPPTESEVVHHSYMLLKYLFGLVPIIAGADKFTNFLAQWDEYLNPMIPQILNVTPHTFMLVVGVIEIIAGILVFAKPRLGGFVVMAWLIAIALQLLLWGRFLDIAVRDLVLGLGGAFILARLAPFEHHRPAHA